RVELHGSSAGINNHGCRRVQVDARSHRRSRLRRQVRSIDLEVSQHTVDDLAVGIHTVTLQTRGVVGVGDVTGVVDLERTGTGVRDRAVVAHGEEAGAVDAHVQHVASVVDVTLGELLGNVGQAHAVADHFAAAA